METDVLDLSVVPGSRTCVGTEVKAIRGAGRSGAGDTSQSPVVATVVGVTTRSRGGLRETAPGHSSARYTKPPSGPPGSDSEILLT
jgi:hypothetical protein